MHARFCLKSTLWQIPRLINNGWSCSFHSLQHCLHIHIFHFLWEFQTNIVSVPRTRAVVILKLVVTFRFIAFYSYQINVKVDDLQQTQFEQWLYIHLHSTDMGNSFRFNCENASPYLVDSCHLKVNLWWFYIIFFLISRSHIGFKP